MRAYLDGVGLLGPGLPGWKDSQAILAGKAAHSPAATVIPPVELLPPAERRRAGMPVKLALAVGREAFAVAMHDAAATATVFSSSSSDGEILHQMCETLATAEREVSPTRFMNSVHNAAAGYWSIATRSREPSTSLCCFDDSFAAGLLECGAYIATQSKPVALIAYDAPYPEPLHAARPITSEFAVAFVLSPDRTSRSIAAFDLQMDGRTEETRLTAGSLEAIRSANPAARSLPLLKLLAESAAGQVVFRCGHSARLRGRVTPCR